MTKPIKIRVLQLGSPMGLYGAERWILALIKYLDPGKVESIVGVIKDDPKLDAPLCKEAKKLGFQAQTIEAVGRINYLAVKELKKIIVEQEIDILHTHGYKQDIIGLLARLGTKAKMVATPHGWSIKGGLILRTYEILDRCSFPFFNAVAPLSRGLYRSLKRIPGLKGKLHLILNGVDIAEIDNVSDIDQKISSLKTHGEFVIGYIGQLISRKGLDVLLKAVAQLDVIEWRLAIVGDGIERSALETLAIELKIEKKVFFFGYRKNRIQFLRGFDLFVLPSRLEGIPRCLMEAMAAEIPVISSNIDGSQELINNNINGLTFSVDDTSELANSIKKIAVDTILGRNIAKNGRITILENFSAKKMAKAYENLYNELLRQNL